MGIIFFRTAQNDLQTLVAHIEAIKKETKDEKQKHEHLMMMKNKNLYDMASCSQMSYFNPNYLFIYY